MSSRDESASHTDTAWATVREVANESWAELKYSHYLFNVIIEHAPAAIAVYDRNLRVLQVSNRWLEIFKFTREQVIDRTVYEIFPSTEARKEAHQRCLEGAVETSDNYRLVMSDGREVWLRFELRAWGDVSTPESGLIGFFEDITEQKRLELETKVSEDRFRLAQAAAQIGTWEWNPATKINSLSNELHEMFGTDEADSDRADVWASRVHPDDWALVQQRMSDGIRNGSMEFEYRYLNPERGLRWFLCKGRKFSPDDDRIFGVIVDVTERRAKEDLLHRKHDDMQFSINERTLELANAMEELRQSEQQFRLLVAGVRDYAIFMLDPAGRILSWNLGAQRVKGYLPQEIIGKHFSTFYPEEDVLAGKPARELEIAIAEGKYEEEGWRVRKDGSVFWANVLITALYKDDELRGFAKVTRDVTERMKSEKQVRELSGRLMELQDEERRRLARELHDSTGQKLSALSLNLTSVKQNAKLHDDPKLSLVINESVDLADEACREIRTMSYLLHPPLLDESGLVHALHWFVDGFTRRTGIAVDLGIPSEFKRLSRELETALFRIVQESLTNVHRHAHSRSAEIRLHADYSNVMLEIRDFGTGTAIFSEGSLSGPQHIGVGLRGMQERVRQLGGQFIVVNAEPGVKLRVVLPLTIPGHQ